ncbi:GIY-YIG nuclease family protein [Schaalia suimastitidis]|uniref:GIY-YIG nuclease family protein n=1 Tax=Schaalia suimastitidis TaxID=121163 RepID=UPI0003FEB2F6|nr:GIY-YIG nuclease family protein [Schaalia suimastitidis]
MSNNGTHIELFLVDGIAGGITTAEITGWTGHILIGPRSELPRILKRNEAKRNGTYILLGSDASAREEIRAYIGKTENFEARFRQHDAKKEFWDRLVLITAKDDAFNEGHWGYLEARLVEEATQAERCHLDNTQNPQTRRLSEAQRSDMEAFLTQLTTVLPVLGVSILRGRKNNSGTPDSAGAKNTSPVFTLTVARHNIDAKAQVIDGEFFLLEGSRVAASWIGKARSTATQRSYDTLNVLRERLITDGSIHRVDDHAITTRDIPFNSPSQAAAIVCGRACNGRNYWTYADGNYATWEASGLDTIGKHS